MSNAKRLILAGLLAAAATIPFVLQRGSLNQLRIENQRLQAQVSELSAELNRVSTNSVRTNTTASAGSHSRDQLHELMRLRAEVTALRKATNAPPVTAAARTPELRAPLDTAEPAVAGDVPEGVLSTNVPPWNNAGYGRPADTLSSMLWGMSQGRMDLVLSAATPEGQLELQREYGSLPNPVEQLQAEGSKVMEVRPSVTHKSTENEIYMTMVVQEPAQQLVAEEGAGGPNPLPPGTPYTLGAQQRETVVKLQKVGNEWRYVGKVR